MEFTAQMETICQLDCCIAYGNDRVSIQNPDEPWLGMTDDPALELSPFAFNNHLRFWLHNEHRSFWFFFHFLLGFSAEIKTQNMRCSGLLKHAVHFILLTREEN